MNRIWIIPLLIAVLSLGFVFWFMSGGVYLLMSGPPKPEITHAEFPFRLVYEKEGSTYEVEDVLICDYKGFGANAAKIGKFRTWKSYLKSGNNRITLLKTSDIEIFYFPVGSDSRLAGVYMGDTETYSGGTSASFPDAWYTYDNFDNKGAQSYIISADEMWENYRVKLISWEISPPIKNTFK